MPNKFKAFTNAINKKILVNTELLLFACDSGIDTRVNSELVFNSSVKHSLYVQESLETIESMLNDI